MLASAAPRRRTPERPTAPRRSGRADKELMTERELCPKCGRLNARIIGRSESLPVIYLRCDECRHTSIAPA